MSLSYTELKGIKCIDPRVNISEARNYLFKQGANVVNHKTFTANSSTTSSVTFKCNPPNPDIVVSRLVYVNFQIEFRLYGTIQLRQDQNAGVVNGVVDRNANDRVATDLSKLVAGNGDGSNAICLRQFPIASVMRTLKININSDTLTVQPHRYIHALGRYNLDDSIRANEMSSSPCQPDAFQKYQDGFTQPVYSGDGGAIGAVAGSQGKNYGQNRSPFASYGQQGYEMPRGSYLPISVEYMQPDPDRETGNYTKIVYDITEPLFISPLSGGQYGLMGFSQINTMDVEISWDSSKLGRFLSIDEAAITNVFQDTAGIRGLETIPAAPAVANPLPANNIANSRRLDKTTGVQVIINQNTPANLTFIYLTPQITRPRPESLIYDWHDLYVFQTEIGNIDAGADKIQTSDNMSLSSIPSRVYIYARLKDGDQTFYSSDTFARIKQINIEFNGVSGILGSAQEWALWRMSSDNGLKLSYEQWKSYTGSVLCIDFGKNMGIGGNQAVGLLGQYNFQYTVTLQNLDTQNKNFQLFTIVDSAGCMTISNGNIVKQLGIISSQDVIDSEEFKEMDADYLEKLYGGNFLSGLKNVYTKAQKLKPMARKGAKVAKELADPVGAFAPRVGKALRTGSDIVEMLTGEGYSAADIKRMKRLGYTNADLKKMAKGGNLVGGAGVPKDKLMKRLKSMK